MRHKKKRTQNQAASLQHPRNPDKLDYSDESSAADTPLDSQEYQRAIRAHLNEFEDMATNPLNGYSSKDGLDGVVRHTHTIPRIPPLPTSNRHPPSAKAVTKKNNSKSGATNGTNASAPRDRIWNTTTNEERERIKEFWLNLGEEERKSLVKVEKEAVLKKMKEQQKHSCSCSVCGRKRTAIEEELEVLYDAYYEELEQYANQQQFPSQSSITAPRQHAPRSLRQSKITEVLHSDDSEGSFEDEEEEDDDLSEDDLLTDDDISDGDDNYSEVEYEEDHAPPEFFRFGNSLTVKGGILTVADDLLKNDGKKFIEMMEQLAERRMQREEEAAMEAREYDDEEEDDYDDEDIESDEYDEDDEEQDALTEEQRMAEGRRMFQIFAARMFEQRVLTAYREKVAQERQAQLLQELELEDSREKEREAKKLKEKEKKKDKKRQQQLKKEEEKAKKEAERLAEETALKAEEERKAEEARKRKEEQRQKREAEKKAIEAEKGRKEEEKRKRLAEEKAREAKRLEQIAKDKKAKEEAQRKEREAKEAAAKEAKAKKDAAKAQREAELAAAETEKLSISQPANVVPQGQQSRRISPITKPASPALAASPAIPIAHNNSHKDSTTRSFQDANHTHSGPRSIPVQQQQFQPPMGRSMTPGAISPQYSQKQNSFPRAALGHPPSMPVPLPPPGIGGSHGTALPNHDPFGFNTQQPQPSMQLPPRQTTLSTPQIPGMQGPPGVFSIAPGLKTSTSPQPRVSTPQGGRMQTVNPFNAFSGLGAAPTSTPRDDFVTEPELTFARRPNGFVSEPSHNGISAIGAIGAIGRPSPARNASTVLPAPIQRPSTLVPVSVSKQTGFEGRNVMGSRALLDDDDDAVVPDNNTTTSSIFNGAAAGAASSWTSNSNKTTTTWTGSAALNGTADDEPYHPPARETRRGSSTAAAAAATAIGTIGVKTSTPVDNNNNNGGGGSGGGGSGTFKQAGKWGF